jgi:hypothetical protein
MMTADLPSRMVLSEQTAQEIYRCKLQLQAEREDLPHRAARSALRGQSMRISYMFDVSPTTVRDIWNHRTWQRVTRHLWEGNDARDQDRRNCQRNGIGLEVYYLIPHFAFNSLCFESLNALGFQKSKNEITKSKMIMQENKTSFTSRGILDLELDIKGLY